MENKYLSFAKNLGIATGAAIAAGVISSEISDQFTDNGKIIGTTSTISQYIVSWATFLPLQAMDNRDIYKKEGNFNWKQFIWDNTKFGISFLALDALYLVGRPFLQDAFIDNGISPSKSSIASDGIFIPAYAAAAVGLARLTGVIRLKKKMLEEKVQK